MGQSSRFFTRIHDEVYRTFYDFKTTVFLCGAGSKSPNSVRQQIDYELTSRWFSYNYDMFYPEDLFSELLYGPGHYDLMTLENILADSVDAIVLVLESYGAVAELVTFATIPKLRVKLVCVVDKQYKRQKSFINYGPLRLIRSTKEGQIVYGDYKDVPNMIDKIRPANPMPAIVYIHGGSWRIGDKAISNPLRSYHTYLARHGFLTVSINYRLSGVAPFPAAVEDCKCAVRWLRANAERYNVDPERIGVWGASAGGHLAMMVGCADETADLEGNGGWSKYSSRVQAVCSYYGTADLPSEYPTVPNVRRRFDIEQFLGGTLDEFPQIYEAASPTNYVTADDPPLLLVHGDLDPQVPFAQSEIMYRVYQQAGLEATLIEVTGGGHGGEGGVFQQVTDSPISPSFDEIHQIVLDFFVKHLLRTR